MSTSASSIRHRLEHLIALAGLLERIEQRRMDVGAGQYRALVVRLQRALCEELPGDALQAVLAAHPAAAELYENLHYGQAGLSRAALERSVGSELQTQRLLQRLRRPSRG